MKLLLAVPALAVLAATAVAQTDTTTGAATGMEATTGAGDRFGTNWSLSVGTTFFSDGENRTLRSGEEISSGWQSLPQEERAMIIADCQTFQAAHGGAAGTAMTDPAGTDGAGDTDTGTETGTEDAAAATTDTGTGSGTEDDGATGAAMEAATTAPTGYDLAAMQAICDAVGRL